VELMAALGPGNVRPPHAQNLASHSARVGAKPLNESLATNDGADRQRKAALRSESFKAAQLLGTEFLRNRSHPSTLESECSVK
jgi:hypothetical protein